MANFSRAGFRFYPSPSPPVFSIRVLESCPIRGIPVRIPVKAAKKTDMKAASVPL